MTLRFMLDTNVCIHAMRKPDGHLRKALNLRRPELCISSVTLHELYHGADKSARPEYQRNLTQELISRLEVLPFDSIAAEQSGNIQATLARKGEMIGAYDTLIAGHARSLALTVVTNNLREFSRVEGLRCEDWL